MTWRRSRGPVFAVARVDAGAPLTFPATPALERCRAILFDTADASTAGGSGRAFDWSLLRRPVRWPVPVCVAGGLTPKTCGRPSIAAAAGGRGRRLRSRVVSGRQGPARQHRAGSSRPCGGRCRRNGRATSATSEAASRPRRSWRPLEELESRLRARGAAIPRFRRRAREDSCATYAGRPTPLTVAGTSRRCPRGADRAQARGSPPHGRAQDQQRARPGACSRERMGKRRIVAETGAGQHGVATAAAAARLGLPCRVYMGVVDMAPPGAERPRGCACSAPRSCGVDVRLADAQGRDQRGDARLDRERRDDALRARLGARPASVSRDGAGVPVGDRPRSPRAVPPARRARSAAPPSRAWAEAPTPSASFGISRRPVALYGVEAGGRGRVRGSTRRGSAGGSHRESSTARARCCSRTRRAGRSRRTPSRPVSTIPRWVRSTRICATRGRVAYVRVSDEEALEVVRGAPAHRRHHPGARERARGRLRAEARPRRCRARHGSSSTSPAAATRTSPKSSGFARRELPGDDRRIARRSTGARRRTARRSSPI